MGDHQHSSFELTERVLQHLFGRDVQMVGGLVQHQQVAGAQQHQGERQASLLATAQLAHLLEHGIVAEAEIAEQGAHLGLRPVGHRFKHRVDDGFAQVKGFGLVLFEIAGHHVVFPKSRAALVRGFGPHHQA